tara:strand:+ start:44195 stop:44962 length:768 start_codon:yes stop_codon:yes gene_type:complete
MRSYDSPIRVVSMYPDIMNTYSDRGNLLAIQYRALQLGIKIVLEEVSLGDPFPAQCDLVLIGGGQDQEQKRIATDLKIKTSQLQAWAEDDVSILAVCGGFQLFGNWYRDIQGNYLEGVKIFDMTTIAPRIKNFRAVGDIWVTSRIEDVGEVVGFENHAGQSYLGAKASSFASVRYGKGNNGIDKTEGAIYRNAIGTYLHGSVLPKNPRLLDYLLANALSHRYNEDLKPYFSSHSPFVLQAQNAAMDVTRKKSEKK